MDVVDWVFEEYDARLRAGKDAGESAREVIALVFEFGRAEELVHARGWVLIQHIYAMELRRKRNEWATREPAFAPTSEPVPVPDPVPTSASTATTLAAVADPLVFGQRRINLKQLQRPESIFDALIHVGPRPMRYGSMTIQDWEVKNEEYKTRADNATARHWACGNIIKRLVPGRTTEQCLGEEEFKRLIPDIGF